MKIWLVDDDEIEELLVSSMLERLDKGIELRSFYDGSEAWEAIQTLSCSDFPDLLLLDLSMPIMDGLEFLERYAPKFGLTSAQNQEQAEVQTEIIILTSSMLRQDEVKVRRYPFVTDYIIKPLMLTQLQRLLKTRLSDLD